jgi:hypothetical protein
LRLFAQECGSSPHQDEDENWYWCHTFEMGYNTTVASGLTYYKVYYDSEYGWQAGATAGVCYGPFDLGIRLASPVTLLAGHSYYLVSSEGFSADQWLGSDTAASFTADLSLTGGIYRNAGSWVASGSAGHLFGPLDLKYATLAGEERLPIVEESVSPVR